MKDEKKAEHPQSPGANAVSSWVPGDPQHLNTIALHAQLACIWEATARKAGNVHRYRDFDNLGYPDFLAAAAAIGPAMREAGSQSLGQTILAATRASRAVADTNVNLGIILLLAPLASAFARGVHVAIVLDTTTIADARDAYAAIRIAEPGGLGEVNAEDVQNEPTVTLKDAMKLAADRDRIASQYANGFADIDSLGIPALQEGLRRFGTLEDAIVYTQLRWLAAYPDSLIARKWGPIVAEEASERARRVLEEGWLSAVGQARFQEFDDWCRDPQQRRNPGTSADLTAASLFVALSVGIIPLPLSIPWSRE